MQYEYTKIIKTWYNRWSVDEFSSTINMFVRTFIVLNVFSFLIVLIDKWLALRKLKRVPEYVFYVAAIAGGGYLGLVGMYAVTHKVRKTSFMLVYITFIILHVTLFYKILTI